MQSRCPTFKQLITLLNSKLDTSLITSFVIAIKRSEYIVNSLRDSGAAGIAESE